MELPSFPFRQLIEVLRDSPINVEGSRDSTGIVHSTGLLFAVLTLERKHFSKFLILEMGINEEPVID